MGKASKRLNLKEYRVCFKEQSNKKNTMLRKLQAFMDTIPAMRKLHVNQKGLVYLFEVTIIDLKDMATMK